jgi:hypothetical protein
MLKVRLHTGRLRHRSCSVLTNEADTALGEIHPLTYLSASIFVETILPSPYANTPTYLGSQTTDVTTNLAIQTVAPLYTRI